MAALFARNSSLVAAIRVASSSIGLPAAAVGLEPAVRTAPDGVHAVDVGAAAALADHLLISWPHHVTIDDEAGQRGDVPGMAEFRGWLVRHARRHYTGLHGASLVLLQNRHNTSAMYESASAACYSPVSRPDIKSRLPRLFHADTWHRTGHGVCSSSTMSRTWLSGSRS